MNKNYEMYEVDAIKKDDGTWEWNELHHSYDVFNIDEKDILKVFGEWYGEGDYSAKKMNNGSILVYNTKDKRPSVLFFSV